MKKKRYFKRKRRYGHRRKGLKLVRSPASPMFRSKFRGYLTFAVPSVANGVARYSDSVLINYPFYINTSTNENAPTMSLMYISSAFANAMYLYDQYHVNTITVKWLPEIWDSGVHLNGTLGLLVGPPYVNIGVDVDDYACLPSTDSTILNNTLQKSVFRPFRYKYVNKTVSKSTWFNCAGYNPKQALTTSNTTVLPPNSYGSIKFKLPQVTNVSTNAYPASYASYGTILVEIDISFKGFSSIQTSDISRLQHNEEHVADTNYITGVQGWQTELGVTGSSGIKPGI